MCVCVCQVWSAGISIHPACVCVPVEDYMYRECLIRLCGTTAQLTQVCVATDNLLAWIPR
jgi:hypothetical protein